MAGTSKGKRIGYWLLTGLICLTQGASGIGDWMGAQPIVDGFAAMGYPMYMLKILGTWKILGVIALAVPAVFPGVNRIREWAYAGFMFDFTGGFVSHLAAGQPFSEAVAALVATFVLAGSYLLLPESRRLTAAAPTPSSSAVDAEPLRAQRSA